MNFNNNWSQAKQRWSAWWNKEDTGRPLLNVQAFREIPLGGNYNTSTFSSLQNKYTDAKKITENKLNYWSNVEPLAEAMPFVDLNLGKK